MEYRGPDGTRTWCEGNVGLGHTLLRTTDESEMDSQPTDIGGRAWIVADARVDDRESLVAALAAEDRHGLAAAPDDELILHGYEVWGDAVVERLAGDFAFVVWDARRRRLFAARDQIGIRPLYYAVWNDTLVVGNTIEALRAHPSASSRLDERTIADFLLFSYNRDAANTAFAGIRRLPPAHTLTWRPGSEPSLRRYWTMPVPRRLRLRREEEYVERFVELLQRAVADRLRCQRAAVLMSGGLDSTSVAAMAREVLASRSDDFELRAFTYVYEELIDDPERAYSAMAAEALSIPIEQVRLDDDGASDLWDETWAWTPEPAIVPITRRMALRFRDVAPVWRVALTGEGGDPALHLSPADFAHHAKRHGASTAFRMWSYRRAHGALPRVGLRTSVKRWLYRDRPDARPVYPPWINPSLEKRLGLRDRFADYSARRATPGAVRPHAHAAVALPEWSIILEAYDPGATKFAAQVRHPYFDLRLLEFLLALPPIPWCVEKEIVRRAMAGRLPKPVLSRRKSGLAGYPLHDVLKRDAAAALDMAMATPLLAEFIDTDRFSRIARRPERLRPSEYELITRPLGLAVWLRGMDAAETAHPRGEPR